LTIADEDIPSIFFLFNDPKKRFAGLVFRKHILGLFVSLPPQMSDAGDEIEVDAPAAEVEVSAEAPKGKMSVEDALQV
jgi:hypothetical protein